MEQAVLYSYMDMDMDIAAALRLHASPKNFNTASHPLAQSVACVGAMNACAVLVYSCTSSAC